MAFTALPQIQADSANACGRLTFDTTNTGAQDGFILPGAFVGPIGITAVASTASASSVEVTTSPYANVTAGTAKWAAVTGLTAIAATEKQAGVLFPITAIRINVTSGLAGLLTLDVLCATYQPYSN